MRNKPTNAKQALRLAIDALNNVPSFDTGIFDETTRRNLTSYQLLPELEAVWKNETESTGSVWVLFVDHKHGSNISAHTSEESALESLYQYCSDEWDEGLNSQYGRLNDLNREQAIEAYFDAHNLAFDSEWYILKKLHIET